MNVNDEAVLKAIMQPDSMIEEAMLKSIAGIAVKEERHLIDELKARLRPEDVKAIVEQQPRYRPLMKSIDWALKRGEKKRLSNFKNELYELVEKIKERMAYSWMQQLEAKGRAIDIMPEKMALRYMSYKNALMVAYELLHAVTVDIEGFYREQGFTELSVDEMNAEDPIMSTVRSLHDILDKELELRYKATSILPEVKRLMEDEGDRVYAYMMKRVEFFNKYAQAAFEKDKKRKEKEELKRKKEEAKNGGETE